MSEEQQPVVFVLEDGVTPSSITFGWNIGADVPKAIQISRTLPTEQLLAQLTPDQFASTTSWSDVGLSPSAFYSYLVSYKYDGKELALPLDTRTVSETGAGTVNIQSTCEIYCSWGWDSSNVNLYDTNDSKKNHPILPQKEDSRHAHFYNTKSVSNRLSSGNSYYCQVNSISSKSVPYQGKGCIPHNSGYQAQVFNALIDGLPDLDHGTYDLLVGQGAIIGHYSRVPGSNDWRLANQLPLPQGTRVVDTALSLAQNFAHLEILEAIVQITSLQSGTDLVAYEFVSGNGATSFPLPTNLGSFAKISGSPALIQSDQRSFEVFVPFVDVILHFTYQQELLRGAQGKLTNVLRLPNPISSAVALAVTQGVAGNTVVIARVSSPLDRTGDTLVAFDFDNSLMDQPFIPVSPLPVISDSGPIDAVTGNPSLLYSTELGAFELLVPRQRNAVDVVDYYVFAQDTIKNGTWKYVSTLSSAGNFSPIAVSLVHSFTPGELEAVVRVTRGQGSGDLLARYTFDQATGWGNPSEVTSNGQPIIVGDAPVNPPNRQNPSIK